MRESDGAAPSPFCRNSPAKGAERIDTGLLRFARNDGDGSGSTASTRFGMRFLSSLMSIR
jgi:hypothetical protein